MSDEKRTQRCRARQQTAATETPRRRLSRRALAGRAVLVGDRKWINRQRLFLLLDQVVMRDLAARRDEKLHAGVFAIVGRALMDGNMRAGRTQVRELVVQDRMILTA